MVSTGNNDLVVSRAMSAETRTRDSDDVELVSSFINTLEKNTSRPDYESLDSPEALRSWMNAQGIPPGNDLRPEDVTRAIEFREAMRLLLLANNGGEVDAGALRGL